MNAQAAQLEANSFFRYIYCCPMPACQVKTMSATPSLRSVLKQSLEDLRDVAVVSALVCLCTSAIACYSSRPSRT